MEQEYFKEFQTKNGNTLFLFRRWKEYCLKKKKKADPAGLTLYVEDGRFTCSLEDLVNQNFQKNTWSSSVVIW